MKTSQERVMKNPKGSPKKQDFLSLKLESCISGSIRSFLIFRAASYFVKHKSAFFFFFFGGGGCVSWNYKKKVGNYKFGKYINFWKHK